MFSNEKIDISGAQITLTRGSESVTVTHSEMVAAFEAETGDVQTEAVFSNGYGVSVIRHEGSYGGRLGLFELAVLRDGNIVYDTPVAGDVLGWLTPEEVVDATLRTASL